MKEPAFRPIVQPEFQPIQPIRTPNFPQIQPVRNQIIEPSRKPIVETNRPFVQFSRPLVPISPPVEPIGPLPQPNQPVIGSLNHPLVQSTDSPRSIKTIGVQTTVNPPISDLVNQPFDPVNPVFILNQPIHRPNTQPTPNSPQATDGLTFSPFVNQPKPHQSTNNPIENQPTVSETQNPNQPTSQPTVPPIEQPITPIIPPTSPQIHQPTSLQIIPPTIAPIVQSTRPTPEIRPAPPR